MKQVRLFNNLKDIGLLDKELFDNFFNKFPPKASELTFTNLYCWKDSKKTKFTEYKNHLIISFIEEGKQYFYQPIGEDPAEIILELLKLDSSIAFKRVEKSMVEKLDNNLNISEEQDMFDYVYNLKDLRTLKGTKYDAKRNFINRFKDNYDYEICEINDDNVEGFLKLQEEWCNLKKCMANKGLCMESLAIKESLNNFKFLNFTGICVRVDNKIVGFAIGEKLNHDTFVDHFEKADTKYLGIYQFLLQQFALKISTKYKYLNREQDLGVEGLRKAKKSYHPVFMVEKYAVKR